MKQIIVLIAAIAFLMQGITVNAASDNANVNKILEKIPSPEQIKQYAEVIKKGNDLYGVKLASTSAIQIKEKASSTLEKILSPDQMSLFEKITKIGASLWGLRKEVSNGTKANFISADKADCVKIAIDKKDDTLITSINTAKEGLTAAINTRRNCQKAAIADASENGQRNSMQSCIQAFNIANKEITTASKKARGEAWKIYKADLKACNEDSEMIIEDGGAELSL